MYAVNDLIMYGGTGVCKVLKIGKPDFKGMDVDRLYYFLEPLYQNGTIYAPVDNNKVFMRHVISKDEANQLIDEMPEVHTEIYKTSSMQQLSRHYQEVIDTHKCKELIRLTKSIHEKGVLAASNNRNLGAIDKRFMKKAEELLFGELAAALKIDIDQVSGYIDNRITK